MLMLAKNTQVYCFKIQSRSAELTGLRHSRPRVGFRGARLRSTVTCTVIVVNYINVTSSSQKLPELLLGRDMMSAQVILPYCMPFLAPGH